LTQLTLGTVINNALPAPDDDNPLPDFKIGSYNNIELYFTPNGNLDPGDHLIFKMSEEF